MIIGDVVTVGGNGSTASIFASGDLTSSDRCYATKGSTTYEGVWGTYQKTNPAWRGLPSGYTQVESITGTGTQWIDLNYQPTVNTKSILDTSMAVFTGSVYYGFYDSDDNNDYRFFTGYDGTPATSNAGKAIFDFKSSRIMSSSVVFSLNTRYQIELGNYYVKFEGASSNIVSGTTLTSVPTGSIRLFKYSSSDISYGTIYGIKIYEGDTLSADLVPCLNTSTSAYGLYDLVSETFFANSGSGSFTAGSTVPQYISSTGFLISNLTEYGTYIVTGVQGSSTKTVNVLVDAAEQFDVSISFVTYLYNEGDECTSLTGGWVADTVAITWSSSYSLSVSGTAGVKNTDNMYFAPGSNYAKRYNFVTTNLINIQNYSKLVIDYTIANPCYHGVMVNFYTTLSSSRYVMIESGYSTQGDWQYTNTTGGFYLKIPETTVGNFTKEFTFPSGVSSGYCEILAFRGSSGDNNSQLYLNKLWLE